MRSASCLSRRIILYAVCHEVCREQKRPRAALQVELAGMSRCCIWKGRCARAQMPSARAAAGCTRMPLESTASRQQRELTSRGPAAATAHRRDLECRPRSASARSAGYSPHGHLGTFRAHPYRAPDVEPCRQQRKLFEPFRTGGLLQNRSGAHQVADARQQRRDPIDREQFAVLPAAAHNMVPSYRADTAFSLNVGGPGNVPERVVGRGAPRSRYRSGATYPAHRRPARRFACWYKACTKDSLRNT